MAVLCGVLASAGFSSARADAIFDFDAVTQGTQTAFSDTQNGITANFSSSGDPGGFGVGPSFFAPPIANNVLLSPGSNFETGSFIPLFATFDTPLYSVNLDFALNDFQTSGFTLQAYSGGFGGTFIGSSQAFGTIMEGGSFPQGSISFGNGMAFDSLQFTADTAQNFAVDNISVTSAPQPSPVPEPGTMALMGVGLASLAAARKRKKEKLKA